MYGLVIDGLGSCDFDRRANVYVRSKARGGIDDFSRARAPFDVIVESNKKKHRKEGGYMR